MLLRVLIEFPALDRFTAAFERYLAYQDGVHQKQIDELTAKLAGSTKSLEDAVTSTTPK